MKDDFLYDEEFWKGLGLDIEDPENTEGTFAEPESGADTDA